MQNLTDLYVENGKIYVAGTYCMGMMDVHCALYEGRRREAYGVIWRILIDKPRHFWYDTTVIWTQ